jgi:hypothetical protein
LDLRAGSKKPGVTKIENNFDNITTRHTFAMISRPQRLAVQSLESGSPITKGAEKAGAVSETVSRWVGEFHALPFGKHRERLPLPWFLQPALAKFASLW